MSTEDNKALVRRHYQEVLTQGKLHVVEEIYAPEIRVGDNRSISREEFKAMAGMSLAAFHELKVNIEDQIAEGDKVVTRWTARAVHRGEISGIQPTGKAVTVKAIHIHRITGGKIAALWEEFDMMGLMQQLKPAT